MNRIVYWLGIVAAQVLGTTVGVCCEIDEPPARPVHESARAIVERYAASLAPFSRVGYTAKIRATKSVNGVPVRAKSEYGVSEDDHGRGIFQMLYRRDHDRLDILELKEGTVPGAHAWASPEQYLFRVVVDKSPTICCYSDFLERRVDRRTPRGYSAADSVRQQAGCLWGGQALDGILPGRDDASLPDILGRAANLQFRDDGSPAGHPTNLLQCTDKGYEYKVWIDPSAGYNPRKIVQRRLDANADGTDVTVDQIAVGRVGEQWVAAGAHVVSTWRAGANYVVQSTAQYDRRDIDFNPDFERLRAFKMVARPGTYAKNGDDPRPIEWVFRDGNFVPKTESEKQAEEQAAQAAMDALVGKSPAELTGAWLTGRPLAWADLKGKVVILDFWATWCGPCRDDLPKLEELHQQNRIVVIGVHAAGTLLEKVRAFMQEQKLHYPVCIDASDESSLFHRFHVTAIPQAFVIGPDGRIIAHGFLPEAARSAMSLVQKR